MWLKDEECWGGWSEWHNAALSFASKANFSSHSYKTIMTLNFITQLKYLKKYITLVPLQFSLFVSNKPQLSFYYFKSQIIFIMDMDTFQAHPTDIILFYTIEGILKMFNSTWTMKSSFAITSIITNRTFSSPTHLIIKICYWGLLNLKLHLKLETKVILYFVDTD